VVAAAFDATGALVATGASDGGVRVWDAAKGYCTHNFRGHRAVLATVRFHPDADRWTLFSASDDGEIRVWDLQTRACTATLSSHMSSVRALDISADGDRLLSAGRDQVLCLWDLRNHTLERTVPVFEVRAASRPPPPPG
jgi:U3 small nucleolar RNA-associated protein 13